MEIHSNVYHNEKDHHNLKGGGEILHRKISSEEITVKLGYKAKNFGFIHLIHYIRKANLYKWIKQIRDIFYESYKDSL